MVRGVADSVNALNDAVEETDSGCRSACSV